MNLESQVQILGKVVYTLTYINFIIFQKEKHLWSFNVK